MRVCATCFHDDRAALHLLEECDQLTSLEFAFDHHLTRRVDGVNLEDGLGGI
jgi:hypothetical protein